jgi:putative ABC transport system permease protein
MSKRMRGIAWLFRTREEIDREVDDEIAFHLEMRTAALTATGMGAAEAREQALREFGDVAGLRSSLRRTDERRQNRLRLSVWRDDLLQDMRFAVRSLRRAPAFTAAALGTLMVGIGAAIATFAVLNAVVLRPLPYADGGALVSVQYGGSANITLAEELARRVPALAATTAISEWGLTLSGAGDAVELSAQVVQPAYFGIFGVRPALGRVFREDERDDAHSAVVLLSDALWRDRFGADIGIVGRRIQLDGYGHRSREVIGVLPRGFVAPLAHAGRPVDLWIPLRSMAGRTMASDSTWYLSAIVGRLVPGASVATAADAVRAALHALRDETPVIGEEAVQSAGATSLLHSVVGDAQRTLWLLLGAVVLVLVLACANLANLLLARGTRRGHELAARSALGASRGRLVRELLTESALLGMAGAGLGMLLARVLLDLLRVAEVSGLPRAADLAFDIRVVAFTTGATLFAVLLFGVLPAVRASAAGLRLATSAVGRVRGPSRSARRFGSALIAAEVALAMVLTTGAALLVASYHTLRSVDAGLDPDDVVTARIAPAPTDYPAARARVFYDDVFERIAALPGVRSVGAIQLLPFTAGNWSFPYLAAGHEPPANAPLPSANFRVVTPGYFAAVDVPLLSGRVFDSGDRDDSEPVGLINHAFAELLWPGQDAVGREILLFGNMPFRVVGVVGDVRQHGLEQNARPEFYRPHTQWTVTTMHVMVEHDGNPAALESAVRGIVRDIDPDVPVVSVAALGDVLGDSLAQRRFIMSALGAFGLVALLLGAIGVYGVMTYAAGARVPEYGVRIALGATQRDVERTAFRDGMVPVLAGIGVGLGAYLIAGRLLGSLLYGITPHDPRLIGAAAVVLGLVAALASWLPARRFSRVQPMRVLGSQ